MVQRERTVIQQCTFGYFDINKHLLFLAVTEQRRMRQKPTRFRTTVILFSMILCGAAYIAVNGLRGSAADRSIQAMQSESIEITNNSGDRSALRPVLINRPSGPPKLDSGTLDSSGQSVLVECSICHSTRTPNFDNRYTTDLKDFHKEVQVAHGNVTCLSCHHPDDYRSLRLADGTRVEFENVMQLCGQCHGQQLRDYQHGAHGGMSGYWDLSRGPQYKNNCVDCHLAHHPKFPLMQTDFKPRDRFLPGVGSKSEGDVNE